MKKLIIIIALISIAASVAAVRIQTIYDSTIQGDLMYRDGKAFYIKTAHGKTPVLDQEIVKVYNSADEDITTNFMNMPSTESLTQTQQVVGPPNTVYLVNASTISTPMWVSIVLSFASSLLLLKAFE